MRVQRAFTRRDLFAHGHGDVPWTRPVVAHPTDLLAHEASGARVDNLFQLGGDTVETVKYALGHQPARFWREALEPIKLIGRTFGFESGLVLHGIGRTVSVAGAAQNTPGAPFVKVFCVKPFLYAL